MRMSSSMRIVAIIRLMDHYPLGVTVGNLTVTVSSREAALWLEEVAEIPSVYIRGRRPTWTAWRVDNNVVRMD